MGGIPGLREADSVPQRLTDRHLVPPAPCDVYPQRLHGSTHPSESGLGRDQIPGAGVELRLRLSHFCILVRGAGPLLQHLVQVEDSQVRMVLLLLQDRGEQTGSMCRGPGDHPTPAPDDVCGSPETAPPPAQDGMCGSPDV